MNSLFPRQRFCTTPMKTAKKTEPMEMAYVDVPDEFSGVVIEKLSQRKGELQNMGSISGGYTRLTFRIPSRGLIGYRGDFLTDTKGNGILNTIFDGYDLYKGDIQYRKLGSLIAFEAGESVTYGLFAAQERGAPLYRVPASASIPAWSWDSVPARKTLS